MLEQLSDAHRLTTHCGERGFVDLLSVSFLQNSFSGSVGLKVFSVLLLHKDVQMEKKLTPDSPGGSREDSICSHWH